MSYLPEGWTEATPGGMATSRDPVKGGIVDRAIVSKEWFVIFEREGMPDLDGFSTRDEAFRAMEEALARVAEDEPTSKAPGL